MNIAIIPSSTESVRCPGKNYALVNGKPALSYPIEAAQASGMFDQVIVSTANEKVSGIASGLGAKVFPSPAALQAKTSTVFNVCLRVLDVLENQGNLPEFFCCIYATALFLEPRDFKESFKLLDRTDFVMGVSEFVYSPEHALIEQNGYLRKVNPKAFKHRAPQFPPQYSSNGTIYWCRTEPFRTIKDFYGPRLLGYEIPRHRAVDINTPADMNMAEKLMNSIV